MAWARTSHRILASLIAAAIATQFFLAGAGAFHATSFAPHRALGWALVLAAAVEFLLALAAVKLIRRSALLLFVIGLQAGLGALGTDTEGWFGALHALNALAVIGIAGTLARHAWTEHHHTSPGSRLDRSRQTSPVRE